jgi:fructose-1,6-bisphosphatase/inositol monophosphatase family enzyme
VITGAADAMVDAHNHVWDVAPSQVLIEEAGGAYAVVRDFESPNGRLLSAVFGKRGVVDRLVSVFDESATR